MIRLLFHCSFWPGTAPRRWAVPAPESEAAGHEAGRWTGACAAVVQRWAAPGCRGSSYAKARVRVCESQKVRA